VTSKLPQYSGHAIVLSTTATLDIDVDISSVDFRDQYYDEDGWDDSDSQKDEITERN
jgi:hypothetical protein